MPGRGTKIDRLAEGYAITPPGGPTYETDAFTSSGRRLIFKARADVVIAVSEVAAIWMKEADDAKTRLAVVGGITVILGIGWSDRRGDLGSPAFILRRPLRPGSGRAPNVGGKLVIRHVPPPSKRGWGLCDSKFKILK